MSQSISLQPGTKVTVTAGVSAATVQRLADSAGGADFAPVNVAAAGSLTIGPFSSTRRYLLDGDFTYAYAPGDAYDPTAVAITGGTIAGATRKDVVSLYASDGALAIAQGVARLTKGSAGAYTLAAPTAGQEGTTLEITAGTAFAHVVTATSLVQDGVTGGAKTTMTFGAFVGASITLKAVNQNWYVMSKNVVVIT